MTERTLADLTELITDRRMHVVDAAAWQSEWSEKWVAFVDLIGIAHRSITSPATTVNQIVRFHRALSMTVERYPDVHILRFTDAAYITTESAEEIVRFTSDLQHVCLALNAVEIGRPKRFFHHLIVARTTIAYGDVLSAQGPPPPDDRFVGVDVQSLLIGKGIVDAYRLERSSAGSLISVDGRVAQQLKDGLAARGMNRPPRRLLERWLEDDMLLSHDGVIDLPGLLLRAQHPDEQGVWASSYEDVLEKLQLEIAMWRLSFTEYATQRTSIETIKHFGAVNRHLNELFQGLRSHRTLKAWDLRHLEGEIMTERSRAGL